MDIKEELKEERLETIVKDHFWGKLIALISAMGGVQILYHDGFISGRLDAYLLGIDENVFGWLLLIFGVLKLLGVYVGNKHMMAITIVGLSVVWSMMFVVSVLWSFGVGYPSEAFLSNGLALAICLRVAYKGIFNGLD